MRPGPHPRMQRWEHRLAFRRGATGENRQGLLDDPLLQAASTARTSVGISGHSSRARRRRQSVGQASGSRGRPRSPPERTEVLAQPPAGRTLPAHPSSCENRFVPQQLTLRPPLGGCSCQTTRVSARPSAQKSECDPRRLSNTASIDSSLPIGSGGTLDPGASTPFALKHPQLD